MTHTASCRCGQLTAECVGEPVRVSVCHCLSCKARSGSVLSAQVRFPDERVTLRGNATRYVHAGDSGMNGYFHFCAVCGTTLWFTIDALPGMTAIPMGNFADPFAFTPEFSVYESRKMAWLTIHGDGIEHD